MQISQQQQQQQQDFFYYIFIYIDDDDDEVEILIDSNWERFLFSLSNKIPPLLIALMQNTLKTHIL